MRVVLDTNVLVSSLISPAGSSAAIYDAWIEGRFTLLTSREQMIEVRATLRKPKLVNHITRAEAGRLVNDLLAFAALVKKTPDVRRSPDPEDDFLLELSEGGNADYLVTGDKSGLLSLIRHGRTRIVSVGYFCHSVLRRPPRA